MAIRRYLAMTAAEMGENPGFFENLAWMACHFSPYGRGLSNLPRQMPPGSLLMVDDITPIHGHDPEQIGNQLLECAQQLGCEGVLLDFQREGYAECRELARYLSRTLPCPVAVTEGYAPETDCAVFLPPLPCYIPLQEYLDPWTGREVWLELALDGAALRVEERGTTIAPLPWPEPRGPGFAEETLHCHYEIREQEDSVEFTLWRTRENLEELVAEAEKLGVAAVVGLYQELRDCLP